MNKELISYAVLGYDVCFADILKGTEAEKVIFNMEMDTEINLICNALGIEYKFTAESFDLVDLVNLVMPKGKDEYSYYTLGYVMGYLEMQGKGVIKEGDEYISRLLASTNFPLTSSKIIDYIKANVVNMNGKTSFEDYMQQFESYIKDNTLGDIYEEDEEDEEN